MNVLAVYGLTVMAMTIAGAVRELAAMRRFHRWHAQQGLRPMRDALVIDDERPQAFCAGLMAPRVYISTGALALLDDAGLDAVLAHERHHAIRRDPLRLATGRVLARALFLPGLKELSRRQQALAELSADESAIHAAPANRSGLAGAILTFSDARPAGYSGGVDVARIDFLLGQRALDRLGQAARLRSTPVPSRLTTDRRELRLGRPESIDDGSVTLGP